MVRAGKEIHLLGIRSTFLLVHLCVLDRLTALISCSNQSLFCVVKPINHLLWVVNHPFDLSQAAYWASDWHSPSFNHQNRQIVKFGLIRSQEAPPSNVVDKIKLVRPIFGLPNPARWLDLYLAAKPSYPKLVSLYLVCQIQLGEHHTKTILVWTYLEYWRVKD